MPDRRYCPFDALFPLDGGSDGSLQHCTHKVICFLHSQEHHLLRDGQVEAFRVRLHGQRDRVDFCLIDDRDSAMRIRFGVFRLFRRFFFRRNRFLDRFFFRFRVVVGVAARQRSVDSGLPEMIRQFGPRVWMRDREDLHKKMKHRRRCLEESLGGIIAASAYSFKIPHFLVWIEDVIPPL